MNQKKMLTYFISLTLVIVFPFYFLSCNILSEPEPLVNNDTHPPQVNYRTAVLRNFTMDQVVSGKIDIAFNPDFDPNDVANVTVYIDTTKLCIMDFIYYYSNFKGIPIEINTNDWPDGKHNITFYTNKKSRICDSLGVNSLIYYTQYVYRTSLIFDNTPPVAPININAELVNNKVHLTWTATNLINFKYYCIRRNGNEIAKIYSQNTSAYNDTILTDFYRGSYEVGVSNGNTTAYSQKYIFTTHGLLELGTKNAIDNLNDQVVFIKSDNSLVSVSTKNLAIINGSNNVNNGLWIKNTTNDTIYCSNYEYGIYTYDVKNLNLIRTQKVSLQKPLSDNITSFAVGPGNKIYLALYTLRNNVRGIYLHVFDNNVSSFDLNFSNPVITLEDYVDYVSVSPDGKNLVIIDRYVLKKYSINNESVIFSDKTTINPLQYGGNIISLDWDNSRIFTVGCKNNTEEKIVSLWDLQTLNLIRTYELPGTNSYPININAIFTNSKNLYIAYNKKMLVEYDISTGQSIRSWKFETEVLALYGSYNGRYLFACTSTDQWIVDIGGTK